MYCLFRHTSFDDNITLYCIEKFAKVVEEGHADHFSAATITVSVSGEVAGGSQGGNTDAVGSPVNPNLSQERLAREREEGTIPFKLTDRRVDDNEDIARI